MALITYDMTERIMSSLYSDDRFEEYQQTFDPITEVVGTLSDAVCLIMSSRNIPSAASFKAMLESSKRAQTRMYEELEAPFDEDAAPADEYVLEKSSAIMADWAERDVLLTTTDPDGKSQFTSKESVVERTRIGTTASVSAADRDGRSQFTGKESKAEETRSGTAASVSVADRDGRSQFARRESKAEETGIGTAASVPAEDRDGRSQLAAKEKRESLVSKRRDTDEVKRGDGVEEAADTDEEEDDESESDSDDDDDDDDDEDDDEEGDDGIDEQKDVEVSGRKRKLRKKQHGEDAVETGKGKRKRKRVKEAATSKKKEAVKEPEIPVRRRYRKIKAS